MDLADAGELLGAASVLPFRVPPIAVVPAANSHAVELLRQFGFDPESEHQHMQRGGFQIPGNRGAVYGQTSFAIG
jgi:hypothetical protein